MKKRNLLAVAFLLIIIVLTATAWFLLNQNDALDQKDMVRIIAFSVDPDGWGNPGGLLITCPFNISLQNIGAYDVQGLKLRVKMFVNGSEIDVKNVFQGLESDLVNDTLLVGEVREFRGELQYSLHHGGAIDSIGVHPAGSSYMAQVMLDENVLNELWAP